MAFKQLTMQASTSFMSVFVDFFLSDSSKVQKYKAFAIKKMITNYCKYQANMSASEREY